MENVAINAKKKITMDKYFSQVKIVTPNNIEKLLNVTARSVVSSVELVNNFLLVSGKVVANAVYLSDENKIESTETSVEFVEKQKANFVATELNCEDSVTIESCSSSSSEVVCAVAHKTEIIGIYRYEVCDASKIDADLVAKTKTINCLNFVASNDETFVVAEEIESNLKEIQLLNIDTGVIVNNIVPAVEKIIVDGKIKVNALYSDENSLGEIVKEFEFKQEIAVKNAMPGMNCDGLVRVSNSTISCKNQDDKNVISFVFDLFAKVYLFDNFSVESFDDVFSLKNEIVPRYEYLEFEENDGSAFETDTILTQTDISKLEDFDDLVGVYQPKISDLSFEDLGEKIEINAKIKALAIYKTKTGVSRLEIENEFKFDTEKDISKKTLAIQIVPSVSAFKVKAGKDLECAFFLDYKFEFEKETAEKYVKSFDTVKEKTGVDAALKVYVAKSGQTLFDIAKALNVKTEDIAKQNEIVDEFETGQKIYVYSPLNLC